MATAHLTAIEIERLADVPQPAPAHLETCEQCRRELSATAAARTHFEREVLSRTLPAVKTRLTRPPRAVRWTLWLALPAAATLLLVVTPQLRQAPVNELGLKGAATVQTFARRGTEIFEVRDGMPLLEGDQLRFEIQPGGLPYLLMGVVDAKGNASLVFPRGGMASARIDPIARFVPPGSAELDAACGPERAFALLSRQPIEAAALLRALSDLSGRGAESLRRARRLAGPEAQAELTIGWEKCQP